MIALPGATCVGALLPIEFSLRRLAFVALVLCALFVPRLGQTFFTRIERGCSRIAKYAVIALPLLFVFVIVARVSLLHWLGVPLPGIHDAFSYLLLADTFAQGRLTNPTHPMWISFETFHVNWLPTYHSMYPPAQGFALAFGQLLGHPWIGVLLSDAAMCAAICWMLRAWLSARWAFLGGVLVGIKFGIASYWMNSYWGGAVAAIGGAIVLGSLGRIIIKGRVQVLYAVLLGAGLAILANSRPYEGLILAIPATTWFLVWLARCAKSGDARLVLSRLLAPFVLVLFATGAWMCYYNGRTTGNVLLMPHTLNVRTYHSVGTFLWQRPGPEKQYRNAQFDDFYNGWERENYRNTWADVRRVSWEKFQRCGYAFFWPGALLLLPGLPFALRDHKFRLLWVTLALGTAAVFAVIWSNAHYAAPFTAIIYLLIVQSFRHLRTMQILGKPVGVALSRAAVLLLMLDVTATVHAGHCDPLIWTCEADVSRFAVIDRLNHEPGKHLIMVRYEENDHNVHDEWVYNAADVDASKIVWARELDARQNRKLLNYFQDRKVWLVTPDEDNTYLAPYTPPGVPLVPEQ